jgi:hypothetical protein
MVWFVIGQLFAILLAWVQIGRLSETKRNLELLLLRQQVMMLERHLGKPMHPSHIEN